MQLLFRDAQTNEFAGLKVSYDKRVDKDHGHLEVYIASEVIAHSPVM